ncbi:MAG: hypothetical protein ACFFD4_14285 [Candidatus Odinarchaeota archaeon]
MTVTLESLESEGDPVNTTTEEWLDGVNYRPLKRVASFGPSPAQ